MVMMMMSNMCTASRLDPAPPALHPHAYVHCCLRGIPALTLAAVPRPAQHRYRFARVRRDQSEEDTQKPMKARIGIAEAAPAAAVAWEEGAKAIDLRAAQARRPTTPHPMPICPCDM